MRDPEAQSAMLETGPLVDKRLHRLPVKNLIWGSHALKLPHDCATRMAPSIQPSVENRGPGYNRRPAAADLRVGLAGFFLSGRVFCRQSFWLVVRVRGYVR